MRADLLRAAMDLFAKGGSRGTSLAAIAQRIGVTTPAITYHFGTKEALLLEIVEELDRSDLDEDIDVDWALNIRAWARALVERPDYANLSRLRLVMVSEALDVDFAAHDRFVERQRHQRRLTATALERARAAGQIASSVDPVAVAGELVAFLQGVQLQWLLDPDDVPLVELVDSYLDRLIDSLAP